MPAKSPVPPTPTPKVGDLWIECDPRAADRRLRIKSVDLVRVEVTFVDEARKGPVRVMRAKLDRFNGKRGGYKLLEAAAPPQADTSGNTHG